MGKIELLCANLFVRIIERMRNLMSCIFVLANKYQLLKCSKKVDVKSLKITGFPTIRICEGADVCIGNRVVIRSAPDGIGNFNGTKIFVYSNGYLSIGNMSGLSNVVLHCFERIEIGQYVNIGDGCMIFDSNFHSTNWIDRMNRKNDVLNAKTSPVIIKDFAFIGARSIICKGVTIGERSIIAAGSCVIKDVPDGELWGGGLQQAL